MRTLIGASEKLNRFGCAIITALIVAVPVSHAIELDSILWWSYAVEPDVRVPEGRPIFLSIQVKNRSGFLSDHTKVLREQYALQDCSVMENMKHPITYIISCMVPSGHESFWKEFLVKLPWVDSVALTFGANYEASTNRDIPVVIQRKIPTRVASPTLDPLSTFRTMRTVLRENYDEMKEFCQQRGRECVEVAPDVEDFMKITISDSKGIILKQYRYWERITIELSLYRGGNIKLRVDAQYASGMNDDREPPLSAFYPMEYKFPREIDQYVDQLTAKLSGVALEKTR